MTVKRRISKLEEKSGLEEYTPILVVIQGQDFEGDHDLETGIQKKLLETGYKEDKYQLLVVRFVASKHKKNKHESQDISSP